MNTKEFFKKWGEGIQKVTPLQQVKVMLIGNFIIMIGIILGLCVTFAYKQWWIFTILVGTTITQGLGFLGTIQKYRAFKTIEMITITKEVDKHDTI